MKHIFKLSGVALVLATLSGCVIKVGDVNSSGGDASTVFGKIEVDDHKVVGHLSTVNGNIELGQHVSAESLSTVNGNVETGEYTEIRSISVVNGNIDGDDGLVVKYGIETVNGNIELDDHSDVGEDVTTVNGDIELDDALVRGDVVTTNGDITLEDRSIVQGSVIFKEQNDNNWSSSQTPTLVIGEDAKIMGNVILQREVNIEGNIKGIKGEIIRDIKDNS